MATNLILLETKQILVGMGSPYYEWQWGNLRIETLSFQRIEDENLPHTKLYVSVNQSLHGLGIEREGVHLLGLEFNSGNYAYWRSSSQFVEDLRWVRDNKQVDISALLPLGYLTSEDVKPGDSFRLEQNENRIILEKILESRRQ
ncbi:MAG: hypothetical protein Q7K45_01205 [Nanoarchaeota archaeon]|nr:hypothetical protein [Nanoarchaeota archaeon]